MLLLCILLCTVGLFLHGLCQPKMLRFARLPQTQPRRLVSVGRIACLLLTFSLQLYHRPTVAIFVSAGTFSLGVVIVSVGWAALARYREVHNDRSRSSKDINMLTN